MNQYDIIPLEAIGSGIGDTHETTFDTSNSSSDENKQCKEDSHFDNDTLDIEL